MRRKITASLKLISEAVNKYTNVACFSSFGKDSMVTLHLARRINPDIQVVCISTPYWFEETTKYKNKIEEEWNFTSFTYINPLVINKNGKKNLYETDVEKCCDYYKVMPSKRAIKELNLDAWISGLRNTEGHTREFLEAVEVRDGLVKINPILKWTEADVWLYHSAHNISPNPLYMQGYRSLGCKPCSLPYTKTERGGRWVGTKKACGECGIHDWNKMKDAKSA